MGNDSNFLGVFERISNVNVKDISTNWWSTWQYSYGTVQNLRRATSEPSLSVKVLFSYKILS